MEIKLKTLIDSLKGADWEKNYDKLVELRDCISSMLDHCLNSKFVKVELINREGNIVRLLKNEFPSYESWWVPGELEGNVGANYILIPVEDFDDAMKDRVGKFDSFYGHHAEEVQVYFPRSGKNFPYYIKDIIDERRKKLESSGKPTDDIYFSSYELTNSRIYGGELNEFFDKKMVVTREWDEPLHHTYVKSTDYVHPFENTVFEF